MNHFAHILIKYRHLMLALMASLFVGSIFLFPKVNVVSDMTAYLPDDSRMKHGLDRMKEAFSGIDLNGAGVNAMFANEAVTDSLAEELSGTDGVLAIMGQRRSDSYTLYQLILDPGTDPGAVAGSISQRYGEAAVVETASTNLLPDNMNFIIVVGVTILTTILVIMCSSIVEVLLFLIAIGIAVAINIGTNAFLPGVSVVTNTIAAILQLILSMDYSIILMNRYRQTRRDFPEKVAAMTRALADATPTILGSSMTTILCMLMLAFMDFKIGLDMGLVLSKGVFLSLVSIYLVLPALVLAFDKAIQKIEKRVPLLHTYKLSKFEVNFRVLIVIVFVVLFASSYFMSQKTKIGFSNTWPTDITREFPPQNQVVLLYGNNEEERVIPVIDSLSDDPNVAMAMSYPSTLLKERTPQELMGYIGGLSSMIPGGAETVDTTLFNADMLGILYYAATHPQRDERMSFADIESLVSNLPAELVGGFDMESMMQQAMEKFSSDEAGPETETETEAEAETVAETEAEVLAEEGGDLPLPEEAIADVPAQTADTLALQDTTAVVESRFTAQNSTRPLTSQEMADFLGFDRRQASAIYRIAGRAKSLMTPEEFVHYITDKILSRNIYAKMISDDQKRELTSVRNQIDSAMASVSQPAIALIESPIEVPADTISAPLVSQDTLILTAALEQPVVPEGPKQEELPLPVVEPTPLEELMDMVASEKKFSPVEIGSALRKAGMEVAQSDVDLLFMYYGSTVCDTDTITLSLSSIIDFITGPLLTDPMYGRFIDDSAKDGIRTLQQTMTEGLANLRGEKYSIATIVSDYPVEGPQTFDYISRLNDRCEEAFDGEWYLIGESVMYKEMSDGFAREMMEVTLLTISVIFLVVALTFKSLAIPIFLLIIVMTAVYICVFVGGFGGQSLNYLAYLVTQSILMGATIDYAILFTDYYREKRMGLPIDKSLRKAYKNSIHSIMTSGMILILCPYIMSLLLTDPTISSILGSISVGAFSAILLIIFVLPGLLAAFDKLVTKKFSREE